MKSIVIILAGAPGCGKGTFLKNVIRPLCESKGLKVAVAPVSDALNFYLDENPTVAQSVRVAMNKGLLVEDSVVNPVFLNAVKGLEKAEENMVYVFDGAPRTFGQIQPALVEAPREVLGVDKIVFARFETPNHICGFRVAGRGRSDDTEDAFAVRWQEYNSKTVPALDHVVANKKSLGVWSCQINGQFIVSSAVLYKQMISTHLC